MTEDQLIFFLNVFEILNIDGSELPETQNWDKTGVLIKPSFTKPQDFKPSLRVKNMANIFYFKLDFTL